jgi:hypothetical protein
VKTYKGFDKDLKCRGFQYEVGKEYEEPTASCCNRGFHACENPLDVLSYYDPVNSRFCEVEQDGDIDKSDDDSKVASSKIKINTEIGLSGLINAGVKFTLDRVKKTNSNTGNRSASTVSGKGSVALVTGYKSKAKASIGSAIVICERGEWNGEDYPLLDIKSAIVDGKKLKADTFYTLKNGKFVEADNGK